MAGVTDRRKIARGPMGQGVDFVWGTLYEIAF